MSGFLVSVGNLPHYWEQSKRHPHCLLSPRQPMPLKCYRNTHFQIFKRICIAPICTRLFTRPKPDRHCPMNTPILLSSGRSAGSLVRFLCPGPFTSEYRSLLPAYSPHAGNPSFPAIFFRFSCLFLLLPPGSAHFSVYVPCR